MKRFVVLAALIFAGWTNTTAIGQKVLKKQAVALFDRDNYSEAIKALDA